MNPDRFDSVDIAEFVSPDGLQEITVFSEALGRRADVTVFVPPGTDPGAQLPIVILLHGVFGSHWAWARSGQAHQILQDLIAGGQVAPAILAMPSDGLFGIGSGYVPRPGGEDAERWIVEDVPDVVRLVHPNAGQGKIAIAGLSMGGWGALRLAAWRPDVFGCAYGLSPLTTIDHVGGYAKVSSRAAHVPPVEDPHLLPLLVRTHDRLPPIGISCGREDELITDVRALHDGLTAARIEHDYAESAGGHTWQTWRHDLPQALRFLDTHLAAAGPPSQSTEPDLAV